ncbi:MAG: TonB-dependent receptor plug domain-containing protein [Salinivirgaceae bacterium]|jgi:hypothetical protein|nr:TonB-dependent receptor plug domain-containing protein [Salinivirgaceae bacterium]
MKKLILATIVISAFFSPSFSQTKVVRGSVFAFKDMALKNIQVTAKKSKASVLTDSLGQFTLVCEKKDKLIFEGKGFIREFKKTGKKDNLRVKMMFIEGKKNEELAIGYGHVQADQLTNAVSNLSDYNNDFCNFRDVYAIIEGRFPGVQVVNVGGSKKILVRGISSVSSDFYALLIVDGIPVPDLDYLPTSSVKTIDVIKDGAIYGSRGANGVVIVSTIGH